MSSCRLKSRAEQEARLQRFVALYTEADELRSFNYGHVLTVASFILAGAGAYYGMRPELQGVDQRVAKIEANLQQLANVVEMTARQDERLIAIERRVDRLEQTEPPRKP